MKKFFNDIAQRLSPDVNKIGAHGLTKLQYAIHENNLTRAMALIRAGADLNLRGQHGLPPLHFALMEGRHHIALALLQAGADVNLQDSYGQTPLHKAAGDGAESFTLSLLKLGANANIADKDGYTPLHVAMTSKPSLIDMLAQHRANPNMQDNKGNTPLHYMMLNEKCMTALIRAGANPDILNAQNKSPFAQSLEDEAALRHPQVIDAMLRAGARRETVNSRGETVLHLSARLNMEHIFRLAVRDADASLLEKRDMHGNNALHTLAANGNAALISQVATMVPQLLAARNHAGQTPIDRLLAVAAIAFPGLPQQLADSARAMISCGADVNARTAKGDTFLHLAAAQKDTAFLNFLARNGADLDRKNADGLTALHIALAQKNLAALDSLLDHGANPDLTDAQGWTVLDRLAEKGDRDSPFVQRLIVGGAAYNKQLPLRPELMRERAKTQNADSAQETARNIVRKDSAAPKNQMSGKEPVSNDNADGATKPTPRGTFIRKRSDGGPPLS